MFDTKVAIVVRDDLQNWQKLNVTAFLMSGIVGLRRSWSENPTATLPATTISACWSSR
jgi:hypothetical protein